MKPTDICLGIFRVFFLGLIFSACGAKVEPVYPVELPPGHGLLEQAEVRMKGARVGHLKRVAGDQAIFVPMEKGMGFHASSVWRISVAGLLGDRFLDVSPGPDGSRKLSFGETIRVLPVEQNPNKHLNNRITKSIEGSIRILDALAKVPPEKREEAVKAAVEAIERMQAEGKDGKND